ncbi:site-specific DNA-methyltransferase [Bifidobacterium longum]|uniref:site-specific DNA-methyltransferase n=1 Tax=Bifidobacterium longum TaxID=216816 RepID=UPI001F21D597|nr:site-specific DNA-methyltransferase [Bifidobacterium longum]
MDKLVALFPDVLTEVTDQQTGETKKAIDFDALRDKLGDVAENTRERYQFTWPGKRAAKAEARKPIAKTLRPVKERSKDWDTTQNLYIEGDNLDALKILRETYAGKIKLIYIDPPYNTGHDFIYKDNFGKTIAADKAENGDYDDDGGQLVVNPESNGRFHSDWCSMIYPRLLLARDLLTSDGVIFISIDDNKESDLQNLCNEIFGERNFVAKLYVKVNPRGRNLDMFARSNIPTTRSASARRSGAACVCCEQGRRAPGSQRAGRGHGAGSQPTHGDRFGKLRAVRRSLAEGHSQRTSREAGQDRQGVPQQGQYSGQKARPRVRGCGAGHVHAGGIQHGVPAALQA